MFGGLVRAYRQRLGLTQEELAHKAQVNVRTVGKLEAGRIGSPRPATVRLLADALELHGPERGRFYTAAASPGQPPDDGRPVPLQLPADVGGFTGRDRQVRQLDDLLDGCAGPMPIAVLTGTAGVGKTALAVHWAHRVRARFADGQLYVNLRGFASGRPLEPIEALAQFLDALGVAAERIPVDVDRAAGLYRSLLADRRILVVLDNARGAEQVRPLLPGSPGCLVLVTSRQTLTGLVARHGARQLSLDVLPAIESRNLLTRLLGAARVGAEPDAVTELVALCEGLPLALRIVAANLTVKPRTTISAYTGQLRAGGRLATLAVEGDEQTGVRATFDLSYRALPDDLRRLFRLLALVPGPDVTPPVAAQLVGVTPIVARRALDQLAGAHLIDEHLPGRYAWHDLLRLYAGELVAAEDAAVRGEAARRVTDWYLRHCDAAAELLYPQLLRFNRPDPVPSTFDDSAQALAWLDGERANLVALAVHAAAEGPRTVACQLADVLRGYFWLRCHTVDWFTVARAGLAAADAAGDLRARTSAQLSLGMANSSVSRHRDAIDHYTEALTLAKSAGWTVAEANALGQIGMAHTALERLPDAMAHLNRALALNQRLGATGRQAINLDGLGRVHFLAGRLRLAEQHNARAFVLQRDGSLGNLGIAVTMLGLVRQQLGQLDQAMEHLTEGAQLTRRLGSIANESWALLGLALTHCDAGRLTEAYHQALLAVTLADQTSQRNLTSEAYAAMATVRHRLGHLRDAAGHAEHALHLGRETGHRHNQANALLALAAIHRELGQPDQSTICARRALAIGRELGYLVVEGLALGALADNWLGAGAYDEAATYARQSLDVLRETGHCMGTARAHVVLGNALRECGQPETAATHWRAALALHAAAGTPEVALITAQLRRGWRGSRREGPPS